MNILEYENYEEKKTHGEDEFPYITYLCTIPLDFTSVPTHWHNEYEIIYEFSKFLHVLSIGFDDKEVESISEMDFVSVMNAINVHYANIA